MKANPRMSYFTHADSMYAAPNEQETTYAVRMIIFVGKVPKQVAWEKRQLSGS